MNKKFSNICKGLVSSVAEPVQFDPLRLRLFFSSAPTPAPAPKKKKAFNHQIYVLNTHYFFLIYKYSFFKLPFINVGTNEKNIIENFVRFI